MDVASQFHHFADRIASLPEDLDQPLPLPPDLRMASDHRHEVYYAPFDHVNRDARLVIVGITPGRVQALAALETARRELRAGRSHELALASAKSVASFAGPMRRNLVDILDHIGVADRLGVPSTEDLWGADGHLVHFTSALRYPVFEDGTNYAGSNLTGSPLLTAELGRWFASECRVLRDAMFVPLGPAALAACEWVARKGELRPDRILRGLPHPSGANAERIAYFLGRKPAELLSPKTCPRRLDAGRDAAVRTIAEWR